MLVAPDFPVTEKKKERKEKEKKLGFVQDFNLWMHFSVRAVKPFGGTRLGDSRLKLLPLSRLS